MVKTPRQKIRHAIEKRHKQPTQIWKRLGMGLSALCLFFMVGYAACWFLDPVNFPLTSVKLIGDKKHLTQSELYQIIIPEMKRGFFQLKVSKIRSKLLYLPWVKQVDVRKVWPHQLVIRFEEHTPAAFWGDTGLLSEQGALFTPNMTALNLPDLPVLKGPDGRFSTVWQQYLEMEKMLTPLQLHITHLVLAPRGAWQLRLSNGTTIILGTHDILARLHRFIRVYDKHFAAKQTQMAYVDLRYTSGMAVGWK